MAGDMEMKRKLNAVDTEIFHIQIFKILNEMIRHRMEEKQSDRYNIENIPTMAWKPYANV